MAALPDKPKTTGEFALKDRDFAGDQDDHPSSEALLAYTSAGMSLVKAYRTHGHLAASLDPLGSAAPDDPALHPEYLGLTDEAMQCVPASALRVYVPGETLADVVPELRSVYCGTIAYEIEHLSSHEQRVWLREAIESRAFWLQSTPEEQTRNLVRLLRVEGFEHFIKRTYLGAKQFSIEGLDVMILMLDEAVAIAARDGIEDVTIGMAHRGRLNVLAHVLRLPYAQIMAEFEGERAADVATRAPADGTGDVKYHYGASNRRQMQVGPDEARDVHVTLLPNPSHLEFVDPVVLGRTRALQTGYQAPASTVRDPRGGLAVLVHGDASFAGQGVVAESLNLQSLRGYSVGGTLHIIANNQVGFTTDPVDGRSTRHSSDMAKGFNVPIFHVNADDVAGCRAAMDLAMAFRARFARDVVIDIVGYRRWGHNEGDEPAYTQPVMVDRIKRHPTVATLYGQQLVDQGVVDDAKLGEMRAHIARRLSEHHGHIPKEEEEPEPQAEPPATVRGIGTAVSEDQLRALNEQLLQVPEGFTPHPKLWQQLERRREAMGEGGGIDWGHAEALAFASLLADGTPIRLTGQDAERGTFSHRHLVLHDVDTGETYTPMQELPQAKASFEVRNSPLSEVACLGFEYGYSVTRPESLVLWEAQFGDFANVAQPIIDQFIAAGRVKWGQLSQLTLLLPHGYEGNGPEHSSARLERFLNLAAEDNLMVAYPTTPAQFFHLLRLQAHPMIRRPLVVMTPKSLLRLRDSTSRLEDLTEGSFQPVIDDASVQDWKEDISRLVLCTGKVYYDLQRHPERKAADEAAVVRIEQLYRFPTEEVAAVVASYPELRQVVWVQEEPQNMGAWRSIRHRLESVMPQGVTLRYEGRPWRASTAEGYAPDHLQEQDRLVRAALGLPPAS
jgi:2-oxoglutarate dehydrogenase E1 component